MVEPALALFGATYEKASSVLEEMLRESNARYTLLLDRKGFVLVHKEALWAPRPPALDSLATLIASNAAATQALAKMLGEPKFNELLHQGSQFGIFAEEVGDLALLVVIFDKDAPVGRIKLFGKKAAQSLEVIAKEALVDPQTLGIDKGYHAEAVDLLDELFGK